MPAIIYALCLALCSFFEGLQVSVSMELEGHKDECEFGEQGISPPHRLSVVHHTLLSGKGRQHGFNSAGFPQAFRRNKEVNIVQISLTGKKSKAIGH